MKILVRQYSSETQSTNYVWKEMRKENPFIWGSYHTADGEAYNISDILQIAGDWRKNNKYVICSNCGKVVRKSALENHYLHKVQIRQKPGRTSSSRTEMSRSI